MKRLLKTLFAIWIATWIVACSKGDYVNSIPKSSIALMSMEVDGMNGLGGEALLEAILQMDNANTAGIDLSCPIYLFETENGNIGLCARLQSQDDLEKAIERTGKSQPIQSFKK